MNNVGKIVTCGTAALALLTGSACATATAEPAQSAAVTVTQEQHLARLMQWWPGDYNNDRQVTQLEADGKPIWRADDSGKGGHIEVTSHYRVIDLPEFGENVLYVEETKHGGPSAIFRRRI